MAIKVVRRSGVSTSENFRDHSLMYNRELPNQHPIGAIKGLRYELDSKYAKPSGGIPSKDLEYSILTREDLETAIGSVEEKVIVVDEKTIINKKEIEAIKDFISEQHGDSPGGTEEDATINFAYRNGFREEFITEEGDTDFHLTNNFVADNTHVKVYQNGKLLTPEIDYIEVSDNHIRLNEAPDVNSYMSFICETMSTVFSPRHEEVISIENQTIFEVKNQYKVGDHSLSVYAHGIRLEKGVHYEELGPNKVELTREPLDAGTRFIFRQESVHSAGKVLYHEKDYQQRSWVLSYVATEGQREVELSEVYIPGANMLMVTVQGLLMWKGSQFDYVEVDEKTIRFNEELVEGEKVTITCTASLYNWSERFVVIEGQDTFKLENIYYTGRNDIIVYENGLQLMVDSDYEELSNNTIRFLDNPCVGSKVVVYKRR